MDRIAKLERLNRWLRLIALLAAVLMVLSIIAAVMVVKSAAAGAPPPREVEGSGPGKCAQIFLGSVAPVKSEDAYLARGVTYEGSATDWSGADFVWLDGRLCGDQPQTVVFIDPTGTIQAGARLQRVDGAVEVLEFHQEEWIVNVTDPTWRPRQ